MKVRLLGLMVLGLGVPSLLILSQASRPTISAGGKVDEGVTSVAPPTHLQVRVREHQGPAADLLDPASPSWESASPTLVLLNRTPQLYQTEAIPPGKPPALEVRCQRAEEKLMVRLLWDDATRDIPQPPPRKSGEGGDPTRLYKRPTGETSTFADAAAVMVPERWTGKEFPALIMGEKKAPVKIAYWNASRGAEEVTASGRATPAPTGKLIEHKARHAERRWSLTLELPTPPTGCPIAFAVWDGHFGDRDGLKFFSVWHVLRGE